MLGDAIRSSSDQTSFSFDEADRGDTFGRMGVSLGLRRAKVARAASDSPAPAAGPPEANPAPKESSETGIPASPPPQYQLYRLVTDYEALQDGFLDRIEDLNTTLEQIDINGAFASGNSQKLLTKNPGKAIARKRDNRHASARRTFGWKSLGKMLTATGMALVLVIDDERFAPLKAQMMPRKRPKRTNTGGALMSPGIREKLASTTEDDPDVKTAD
jgi:hypothetical protein